MRCFHPITIDLSDTDARPYYIRETGSPIIKVPCGKCISCLKQKRNEWVFRMNARQQKAKTAYFITLTYSDENLRYNSIGGLPTLSKDDIKKFLHQFRNEVTYRCRQLVAEEQNIPVRQVKNVRSSFDYFAVGEYGDAFDRPHYHIVLFDAPFDKQQLSDVIRKYWKYEDKIPDIRYSSGRLLNYITKYMLKKDIDYEFKNVEPPFRLMSKGVGKQYVTRSRSRQHVLSGDFTGNVGMARYSVPRYLKRKLQQEFYERYHAISKNDKDFYLQLGAETYHKSQQRAKVTHLREVQSGLFRRHLADVERIQLEKEQKIIESKKLRYRQ